MSGTPLIVAWFYELVSISAPAAYPAEYSDLCAESSDLSAACIASSAACCALSASAWDG